MSNSEPPILPGKAGKKSSIGLGQLEIWANVLLQRMFPVWYCVRYITEMSMELVGDINPRSFLSHRWLSVGAANKAAAKSLLQASSQWHDCAELLKRIHKVRTFKRYFSVRNVMAVEQSDVGEGYGHILEYANSECRDIPNSHAEHFDQMSTELFGDKTKHYPFVYREWDGRYYYKNLEEPLQLGALLQHCHEKNRDLTVKGLIEIEYADIHAVELLRSRYWLLLMKRESANQIAYLVRAANIPCQLADFEWRRSDLIFMVLKKNDYRTAQIVEALVLKHFPKSVIDWGRYLCTHQYPFRNR